MIKKRLNNFQERIFDIATYLTYFLIIISSLGLSETAPQYLDTLDHHLRIYICLFLVWRFNPLRSSYEFTNLDRKIVFSAGIFILTTTVLNEYLNYFKDKLKNII